VFHCLSHTSSPPIIVLLWTLTPSIVKGFLYRIQHTLLTLWTCFLF
jgi:hypothetical protein